MAICVRCHHETFKYRVIPGEGDVCLKCIKPGAARNKNLSTFPFTTTHLTGDGREVTVESLAHLRKLEAQYGVQSAAYNLSQEELECFRLRK